MKNGWTGGQYSVYRVLLGLYLFVHFLGLLPWGRELFSNRGALPDASVSPLIRLFPNVLAVYDHPAFVAFLLVTGAALSLFLAVGWRDRTAGLLLWYLWACLFGRNPLISNPSLPYIGWLLLAHAILPAAPYGSWSARGRADPRGDWQMSAPLFTLAWILMALGYSYSGYTKLISPSWLDGSALAHVLNNPLARLTFVREMLLSLPPVLLHLATWGALALELGFAPLAVFRKLRPWIWSAMVALHLGLFLLIDFADLTAGMLLLHAFTFDPAWIRPRPAARTELFFYDGHCGLCHSTVRFALAEDREGRAFRFSPLQGNLLAGTVAPEDRASLPDSIVVQKADGALLTRSAAILHVLRRLGGVWTLIAASFGLVPRGLLDKLYDAIARVRHRVFRAPAEACPLVPPDLRARFAP